MRISFQKLFGKPSHKRPRRTHLRPGVELLEDRLVPATLHVGPAETYTTIQGAVNAASSGDTIIVDAGTYNELVTVNVANLTIDGAQAGVDGRNPSRTGLPSTESVLDNSGGGFDVAADNVIIDGFTIEDSTNMAFTGAGILLGAGFSGAHVIDNIIQDNIVGLDLASDGANLTVIQFNLFQNNNQPGPSSGTAIYSDQFVANGTLSNVLIDNNEFLNQLNVGIGFASTDQTKPATGITISNNVFNGNGAGLYAYNLTSSAITGNTFTGSTSDQTADLLLLEGDNGLTIENNLLQNGAGIPLWIANTGTGAPDPSNIVFTGNSMSGYAGAAPWVEVDNYNGTLNARGNWWGTNNPNVIAMLVTSNVDFSQFLPSGTNLAPPGSSGFQGAFPTTLLLGPSGLITTSLPTFSWAAVAGADHYDLWVTDDTTGVSPLILTSVNGTSFTPSTPLNIGDTFTWWVRSVDSSDTPADWSVPLTFTIAAVPTPVLNGPSVSAGPMPTFSWTGVAGAAHYDIWVDNETTGQTQVIRNTNVAGTSFTPGSPLVVGDTYTWWVRAVNGSSMAGFWSIPLTFTVFPLDTPVLIGPIGQTTGVTPTFTWNGVSGADHYDLWVNDNTSGVQQVVRNMNVSGTSFISPALTLGDSYTWWVRAVTAGGVDGDWSTPLNFSLAALPAVTLVSPAGSIFSQSVTFSWNSVLGAQHYDLWVNDLTTGAQQVIRQTSLTNTSFVTAALNAGDTYQWWVRALDGSGNAGFWSTPATFTISPPLLISPSGMINNELPTFSWTAFTGAAHYDIWVDDLTSGTSQVIRNMDVLGTSLIAPSPLALGDTYRWWVRAVDGLGNPGPWSAFLDFTEVALAEPVLIAPSGPVAGLTPTFTWNAVANAANYDLWVNDDTTGTSQVIRRTVATTSFVPAPLAQGHQYTWWVAAVDQSGKDGPFSDPMVFTVA